MTNSTPSHSRSRPKGIKARHRTRLEKRLKQKLYLFNKLAARAVDRKKVTGNLMRITARRVAQLKKKLAA